LQKVAVCGVCFVNEFFLGKTEVSVVPLDRNEFLFPYPEGLDHTSSRFYSANIEQNELSHEILKMVYPNFWHQLEQLFSLTHGAEDGLWKTLSLLRISGVRKIYLPVFSWGTYEIIAKNIGLSIGYFSCEQNQNFKNKVKNQVEYSFDFLDLSQKLTQEKKTCVIMIPSVNNPTGHNTTLECFQKSDAWKPFILGKHFILADCVYDTFCNSWFQSFEKYESWHNNLVVLGSLSKYFGIPGARVGFMMGYFSQKAKLNLGISRSSTSEALSALSQKVFFDKTRDEMIRLSNLYSSKLATNYWNFSVSEACFLLLYAKDSLNDKISFFEKENFDFVWETFNACNKATGVRPKLFFFEKRWFVRWTVGTEQNMLAAVNWMQHFEFVLLKI
jgi:aspartate/methionine/tyrosine aminotransferase